jgi:hypothetical protein
MGWLLPAMDLRIILTVATSSAGAATCGGMATLKNKSIGQILIAPIKQHERDRN